MNVFLERMEKIWDEYQVYSSDELNPVNDKMSLKKVERDGEK